MPLTEKGEADAAMAGQLLSQVSFDKIYASDLLRARNTADIAIPGCKYELDEMLREIDVGDIAGKPLNVIMDENNQPKNKDGYALFGGESIVAFDARVAKFMKQLEGQDFQNVALFCHNGWIRSALDFVVGSKLPWKNICCNNCTIAVFEYQNSAWKLHSWINL